MKERNNYKMMTKKFNRKNQPLYTQALLLPTINSYNQKKKKNFYSPTSKLKYLSQHSDIKEIEELKDNQLTNASGNTNP